MKARQPQLSAVEAKARLLAVFERNAHTELTIGGSAYLAGITYSQACRNLRYLAADGELLRRPRGGMAWYRINPRRRRAA